MTVRIDKVARGEYEAWKITPYQDDSGSTLDPIDTTNISKPIPYGQSVDIWATNLDDNELEAALLIFTDRWTWDEGTPEDKICLEAIEREKERRDEETNWQTPPHSHVFSLMPGARPQQPFEGMVHSQPDGKLAVYRNGQWCPVSISSQKTIQHAHSHGRLPNTSVGATAHTHPIPKKSSP